MRVQVFVRDVLGAELEGSLSGSPEVVSLVSGLSGFYIGSESAYPQGVEPVKPAKTTIDVTGLLSEAGEIERRFAEWQKLVIEEEFWKEKQKRDQESRAGIAELELLITKQETELKGEMTALQGQLTEKRLAIERYQYATTEHEYDTKEYQRLAPSRHRHQALMETGLREKIRIEAIEEEMAGLRRRLDGLREGLPCEFCGQPAGGPMAEPIGKATVKLDDLAEQLRLATERIAALREEYLESEKNLKRLEEIGRRLIVSEMRMGECRELESESEKVRSQIEQIQTKLRRRDFARKEQKAIAQLENDIRLNGYDAEKHRSAETRRAALETWREKKMRLDWVRSETGAAV